MTYIFVELLAAVFWGRAVTDRPHSGRKVDLPAAGLLNRVKTQNDRKTKIMVAGSLIQFACLPFLTLLACLWSFSSHALTVKGVEVAEVIPGTQERPALKLNGASVRVVYKIVDAYLGKLYLENPSSDPEEIFRDEGYKRMVFHVMTRRISAEQITEAISDILKDNMSKDELQLYEDQLATFSRLFEDSLFSGEQGTVDYVPGIGTRVSIRGEIQGVIPGKDFFNALLTVWIGEYPVSNKFKDGILGLPRSG